MIRRYIPLVALVVLTMAFSTPADLADDVERALKAYYNAQNRSQLVFLFNQPKYAAGDTAYFSGYLFESINRKALQGKHVVTLQLADSTTTPILTKRFLFENGFCAGQIILPRSTAPGYKLMRAFSDEMLLNHDDSNFFEMPFCVSVKKRQIPVTSDLPLVGFEGGNLVPYVTNRIVILYTAGTRFTLYNSSYQPLATATTDSTGTASVILTPATSGLHTLSWGPGKSINVMASASSTVALELAPNHTAGIYQLAVRTLSGAPTTDREAYAVVSSGKDVLFTQRFITGADTLLSIPFDKLKAGINRITIFADNRTVLAERVFYHAPSGYQRSSSHPERYVPTRGSSALNLALSDASGQPIKGRFSVSIIKDDLFTPDQKQDLNALVSIQGEGGLYRCAALYPYAKSNDILAACYTPLPWEKIFTNRLPTKRKKASPYYFKGRAIFRDSKLPLPDSSLITFYLNRERIIFGRHTTHDGDFEFPLFMNFEDDELFYRVEHRGKILPHVVIVPVQLPPAPRLGILETRQNDAYESFSTLKKVVDQSFAFYAPAKTAAPEDDDEIQEWKDDFHVNLDALDPFPNMTLVLQEVVQTVQLKNNKKSVRVFLKPSAMFAPADPIYIIDGTMTDSTGFFLSLNPSDVSMIRVIRSNINLTRFGTLGRNGIIIVTTHNGKYVSSVPNISSLQATGLQRPLAFTSPHYTPTSTKNRTPDLRAALFWKVFSTTDGNIPIALTASDLTGRFRIVVEGKTDDGAFIHYRDYIDIRYDDINR